MKSLRSVALVVILAATLTSISHAGLVDPCLSTANLVGGPVELAICPDGDGQTLADFGAYIDITARNGAGNPCAFIPFQDVWLISCDSPDELILCGNSLSSNADANTDINGQTTLSGTIAAGGHCSGVQVVIQGIVLVFPLNCFDQRCLAIETRSVDIDGSLGVNLADLADFAMAYPPNPYDPYSDFDFSGAVSLVDLAYFAQHYLHRCAI